MSRAQFWQSMEQELARIENASTSKRREKVITGFTSDPSPQAIIGERSYRVFNSNDYLGLRHHPRLQAAEAQAGERYGTGPGAVRFISGTLHVHKELEAALAKFHHREDAIVFSSAFAANLAVMFCLLKGQTQDSLISGNVLVVSDALNHRSIIDGIRLPNLEKEQKQIFAHLDAGDLERILTENKGKFDRVIVVTDGVFSMLGEYQDLRSLRQVIDAHDQHYKEGVTLVVDDCHGVAACGETGRGTEEVTGVQADVLVGTLGKGFGADGGYIVGDSTLISFLRESAATYIYSNSISPGTAGAARAAVELLDDGEGKNLLANSRENIDFFQKLMKGTEYAFAADSSHPIQPVLVGDPHKARELTASLFEKGFLITNISYPVVAKGKDELRVQISATHTKTDIELFVAALAHK